MGTMRRSWIISSFQWQDLLGIPSWSVSSKSPASYSGCKEVYRLASLLSHVGMEVFFLKWFWWKVWNWVLKNAKETWPFWMIPNLKCDRPWNDDFSTNPDGSQTDCSSGRSIYHGFSSWAMPDDDFQDLNFAGSFWEGEFADAEETSWIHWFRLVIYPTTYVPQTSRLPIFSPSTNITGQMPWFLNLI